MKYRKTNKYQICCFYCVIHNNVIFVWKVICKCVYGNQLQPLLNGVNCAQV